MSTELALFPLKKELFVGKEIVVEERAHGVVRMILKRSEVRNALHLPMIEEALTGLSLASGMKAYQRCRFLILEGEGPVFCAGADIKAMQSLAKAPKKDNLRDAELLAEFFKKLASFPAPVVSYIQGAAIGGGCGLAAVSDIVLAEASAIFGTSEVLLGVFPSVISPYLVRKVGLSHASALMMTGKKISSQEAKSIGLVTTVVPQGDGGREALITQIYELLKASPEALRRTKRMLLTVAPMPSQKTIEITSLGLADARCSPEAEAGLKAYLDKADPPWARDIPTRK